MIAGAAYGPTLAFVLMVHAVTAQASTCEAAAEESARATLQFISAVAGVREPKRCDPADKEQMLRVLAAAAYAQSAVQAANKACGRPPDIASDPETSRFVDAVKTRIAQCFAAGEGSK